MGGHYGEWRGCAVHCCWMIVTMSVFCKFIIWQWSKGVGTRLWLKRFAERHCGKKIFECNQGIQNLDFPKFNLNLGVFPHKQNDGIAHDSLPGYPCWQQFKGVFWQNKGGVLVDNKSWRILKGEYLSVAQVLKQKFEKKHKVWKMVGDFRPILIWFFAHCSQTHNEKSLKPFFRQSWQLFLMRCSLQFGRW